MTISKAAYAILLGGALAAPGIAGPVSFPASLHGKSVTVKWTENRQVRFEGSDHIVFPTVSVTLQVYISTAGRAFSKESVSVSGYHSGSHAHVGGQPFGGSFERKQAPDGSSDYIGNKSLFHFEGGTLVMDTRLVEGARRVSITFDAGYSSCNARVIFNREGGTGAIRSVSGITGKRFELMSVDVSTPSCSVMSGNVFGGE